MQIKTPTLNQHIFSLVLKPTLMVAMGLLALVWLMQSLRFLDLIINKGLSIGTFLHLTSLFIPFLLTIILPLATLAGAIHAFKIMNDDNELPAMFGAGLSRKALLRPALWVALVVMLFGYVNALYLTPAGMSNFKQLQHEIRYSEGHLLLEEGTFNPLGDDIMVYLKNRVGKTGLNMILVHDSRNKTNPVTWMAKSGQITFSPTGTPRLTLTKGIRQEVTPTQTSMLAFDSHTLDIQRQIAQPPTRVKNAEERFMSELTNPKTPKIENQYKAEIMRRLIWPFTPVILVLIAGAFLVAPRATRRGVLRPTIYAGVTGVLYVIALIGAGSTAEGGNALILYGQIALPLITLLVCLFYLKERTHA